MYDIQDEIQEILDNPREYDIEERIEEEETI